MDEMAGYYCHNPYYPQPPPPPPPPPPQQLYAAPPPPPPPPPSYHHHHQYHPPPLQYAANSSYPQNAPIPSHHNQYYGDQFYDDLRTLFVAGLPEDVETREIYNLFREFPGYESSKLRRATEHNKPYGFAVFLDQPSAVAAMQALNGLVFDLEKKSTLYISLAKSNSKSKRSRTDDGASGSSDKKFRGSAAYSNFHDTGVGSNIHMPGMGNSAYNMIGYSSTQSHGYDSGVAEGAESRRMKSSTPYIPQNSTPCPTLFVANLGPTCAEQELIEVFSRCTGFLKLKMQNKNGAPVAFVDFQVYLKNVVLNVQDIACSTAALNSVQDMILYTSNGEGMRLEYPLVPLCTSLFGVF
ncbi:hypothetical protein IFM89_024562 [Coptis chinensis]|uniref:RRM domain-containing protein n=1 Tax=Coptis chinensis TaxID=261450 RepID=A0A835IPA2_9MAGN|nr:hypothetical protein IFM89_024562 [Coptis chinensis]